MHHELKGVRPFGELFRRSVTCAIAGARPLVAGIGLLWLPFVLLGVATGDPRGMLLLSIAKFLYLSLVIRVVNDIDSPEGTLGSTRSYLRLAASHLETTLAAWAIRYAAALAVSVTGAIAISQANTMGPGLLIPIVLVAGAMALLVVSTFTLHAAVTSGLAASDAWRMSRHAARYTWRRVVLLLLLFQIIRYLISGPLSMELLPAETPVALRSLVSLATLIMTALLETLLWINFSLHYRDVVPLIARDDVKLKRIATIDHEARMKTITAPYGSWKSPISAELVASGAMRLGDVQIEDGTGYAAESRPDEGGRTVVVCLGDLEHADDTVDRSSLIPEGYNVRTRVHEYGGAAWRVEAQELFFVNFADQRIYRTSTTDDAPPEPVTPEGPWRYADGRRLPDGSWVSVREDHTDAEPKNTIVRLMMDGSDPGIVICGGRDFYASPRVSPDGSKLLWLCWDHPDMPWDGAELWSGTLEDGAVVSSERIDGGDGCSVYQPDWGPDGEIYYVCDRTGWWNLYRHDHGEATPLAPMEAEFGRPLWGLGSTTWSIIDDGDLFAVYTKHGRWRAILIDPAERSWKRVELPYDTINSVVSHRRTVVLNVDSASHAQSIVALDLETGHRRLLRKAGEVAVDRRFFSLPESIDFESDGQTAHALYYPPVNPDYVAPAHSRPPLLVVSHGGPTSMTSVSLSYAIQFWTSRGFGVLDVNYRGSTGYGRKYRELLIGNWGIADVADCINGATYLVEQNRADPDRLIIRGGSAGGYTTLCALAFHDRFSAGASYYGISDLETIVADTHKFESRYTDSLIGPYPEARDIYRARSPIHATDAISCPVILLQGLEDRVVPPSQSETMYEALKQRGIPVCYVTYPDEQHGFRSATNRRHALESELSFYSQVLGFPLAESVPYVGIDNLAQPAGGGGTSN